MAIQYRSAAAVASAVKAESSLTVKWAEAYAAAHADMQQPGANLRDLGQAITKAGVKCGKDLASDFVLAHGLTVHGTVFIAALAQHLGEGKVMRAHSLITKARNARGVDYVRGVLRSLEGLDQEALAKAIAKAVRELDAAKHETKTTESTPASKAASIVTVFESLANDWRSGVPGAEAALMEVFRACRVVAEEHRAAKQAA